jgi:hypothetical protein
MTTATQGTKLHGFDGATTHPTRARLWRLMLTAIMAVCLTGSVHGARAADGNRWVSAQANCGTDSSNFPLVRVTVTNHSGLKLYVAYRASFTTSQAISPRGLSGMGLGDPGAVPVIEIANGASKTIIAPWTGASSSTKS